jgi:carbon storage regulator
MLVIRRRAGQGIQIGGEIELEVLDITPSRVTIGVRAPRTVNVVRREVVLAGSANLAAAVRTSEASLEALADQLRHLTPWSESS